MPKRLTEIERLSDTMSELTLEREIIRLAERYGWYVYSVRRSDLAQPNGTTHRGYPDLTLLHDGMIVFAELKTRKGKLSEHQERWINRLRGTFTSVHVWRPQDWLDGTIEKVIRATGRRDGTPPPPIAA